MSRSLVRVDDTEMPIGLENDKKVNYIKETHHF